MNRDKTDRCVCEDYRFEVLKYYREKEGKRRTYYKQSPQLGSRRYLVDLVALVGEQIKLCRTTHHLCIYLLDYFMDNHDIEQSRLHLVSLACLLVASKFIEKDSVVPRISELKELVDNEYNLSDFILMEFVLLRFFNWNLMVPTAAHFCEIFSRHAIALDDQYCGKSLSSIQTAYKNVHQYIGYFLDVSLQDYRITALAPSMVAASCIAATRLTLLLTPTWSTCLYGITKYKYDQLLPCISILLKALEKDEIAEIKESLTESPQSCSSSDSIVL